MFVGVVNCVAYGVAMRVAAGTPELFAELSGVLPYGTETSGEVRTDAQIFSLLLSAQGGLYCCSTGGESILESSDLAAVLEALKQALMIHVANYAEGYVFVHAGVVAYHGIALILPGSSFAGKSTLTAALVRAGATYYSDEYAVLDDEGHVFPYARDLSMRNPGETQQRSMPVLALGGLSGTDRLPVGLVVFTRYVRGAEWSAESVSSGMAILEMLKHSIPVQRTPARVMATLAAMMKSATAWTSLRGEADVAATALLAWMSAISSADSEGLTMSGTE